MFFFPYREGVISTSNGLRRWQLYDLNVYNKRLELTSLWHTDLAACCREHWDKILASNRRDRLVSAPVCIGPVCVVVGTTALQLKFKNTTWNELFRATCELRELLFFCKIRVWNELDKTIELKDFDNVTITSNPPPTTETKIYDI